MRDHYQFVGVVPAVFGQVSLSQLGLVPCVLGQYFLPPLLIVPTVAENLLWKLALLQIVAG